jgi:hypothetical protein
MRKSIRNTVAIALGLAAAVFAFLYIFAGGYLLQRLLHRPGWPEMASDDFRLSHAMRTAWKTPVPAVHPGAMAWKVVAPGLEVAELPVLTASEEVDRFYLVRVDPARYRFSVHTKPRKPYWIDGWEKALPKAAVIVNGSFFGQKNVPDTPILTGGVPMGPQTYDARAGAFVAGDNAAQVVDLRDGKGWQAAFVGASDAMVAYPLLIGDDGSTHVNSRSRWLANRSFVGQDGAGRIIIGSTKEAFFSLDREANFLKAAPLDLKRALNLDGGPVACQSVRAGTYHRLHIARWEAQEANGRVKLLNLPVAESEMPIVLVAEPKS